MASVFRNAEGLLQVDYLDIYHTITGSYYAEIRKIQHEKLTSAPPQEQLLPLTYQLPLVFIVLACHTGTHPGH